MFWKLRNSNLRSYPPSLYLDAEKEGMINLLVGLYVRKSDSVFFFLWLVEKQYFWFAVFWLVVIFQPEAGQKTQWCRRSEFSEDAFSFEAPTNFNYNSLKAEYCSGEDVLAVLSAGFLKTTKVLERFRTVYKMKTAIYFLTRLLGSPRSCSLYYP